MSNDVIHPVLKKPMHGMYYVWAVETIEQFRGKGHASRMLNQVLDKNKSYFLRVRKDNGAAIHIYKKIGFEYCKDSGDEEQIMIYIGEDSMVHENICQ